jgi:hypothetical protein
MLLPPGMHQQALKKGDIVLSARQTESLLRTGKAIGTGHAYAYGTLSNAHYNDVTAKQTQSNPWKNKKDSGGDTYNVDTYNNYESGSDSKKGGGGGGSDSDDSSSDDAKEDVKDALYLNQINVLSAKKDIIKRIHLINQNKFSNALIEQLVLVSINIPMTLNIVLVVSPLKKMMLKFA